MFPRLAHLYGPLWIQSYGTMIALGLLVFLYLTLRHPRRKKLISTDVFMNGVFVSMLAGVAGGRLLYVLSYPYDFTDNMAEIFFPWVGGLTVIGAIVGVIVGGGTYLWYHRIPILPIFDLAAVYGPCLQAIARFGCFAAGCCYGAPCGISWLAVTFTNPAAHAPLYVALHPAQLYASAASAAIFVVMLLAEKRLAPHHGMLFFLYLLLENAARFFVDFWRGDRDPIALSIADLYISQVQVYALLGLLAALLGILWLSALQRQQK